MCFQPDRGKSRDKGENPVVRNVESKKDGIIGKDPRFSPRERQDYKQSALDRPELKVNPRDIDPSRVE